MRASSPLRLRIESCNADKIVLADFVDLGSFAQKKKVVWTLPAGYVFCPRAGDGVFLKDPNVPDDLFDPNAQRRECSDTFEWKRTESDGKDYAYLLRFRTRQ